MKKTMKAGLAALSLAALGLGFAVDANAQAACNGCSAWVISPDSLATNPDNSIAFGNSTTSGIVQINANAANDPTLQQPTGIIGAGFSFTGSTGAVAFDADLWTWDSYSAPTGGNTGYYDSFIVTISTTGYYWDSAHVDPIASSASTWVWGGQDFGAVSNGGSGLEHFSPLNGQMVSLDAGPGTYYVSVVIDTATCPYCDTNFASWGSWHVTPVPEPETYAMLVAGLGLMGFVARRRQRKLAA